MSAASWRAPHIVVRAAGAADADEAGRLARRLEAHGGVSAAVIEASAHGSAVDASADAAAAADGTPPGAWVLLVDGMCRTLVRADGVRLAVDFVGGRSAARQREAGLARQPLARAIGTGRLRRRLGRLPLVVDATGGLGRDAWFVAALGCPVSLIERSPIVHALLEAALARARLEPGTAATAARVELVHGDARALLHDIATAHGADVVYVDPMYPPTRRRAAVTKGMQFLHDLLGPDTDDAGLLGAALGAARRHVVVKRPAGAPPLAGDADFTGQRSVIESPGTRYDVYHTG